ncbi:hypothetical protein ACMV8I_18570 [Ewingella sp. S1.OA.A_B6]
MTFYIRVSYMLSLLGFVGLVYFGMLYEGAGSLPQLNGLIFSIGLSLIPFIFIKALQMLEPIQVEFPEKE